MSTATVPAQETQEQMIARLIAENSALKAKMPNPAKERHALNHGLSCRVGEKGGISIYGLNRKFPVTLYKEQFDKLVAAIPQLQEFVNANASKLTVKPTVVK